MAGRGGLLRQREFRLLWTGETVSMAGTALAAFVIPLLAASVLRASTFEVAALAAATYLPWLIIGLPAGAWADRLPSRPLMIGCDLVAAALYASLPLAAWAGVLTIGQVLAVALLAGAVNVLFTTAYQVYLPSLVTTGELAEGNAKLQGSASMALLTGRSTAGLATTAFGAVSAVLFNAGSFLVSAFCLLRIRSAPDTRRAAAGTTVRAEIAAGARLIALDPYLRPLTMYAALGNLAYSGYVSLQVVFLVRTAGFGATVGGLLLGVTGLGGMAGALVARRLGSRLGAPRRDRRPGALRGLTVTTLVTTPFGLLIPLTRPGPWVACFVAGTFVLNAGSLIGSVIVTAFRQAYCPPEMLGRAVAGMRFVAFGTIPAGALLAGAVGSVTGVRTAMWIVLAANALAALILLRVPRELSRCRYEEISEERARQRTLRSGGTMSSA